MTLKNELFFAYILRIEMLLISITSISCFLMLYAIEKLSKNCKKELSTCHAKKKIREMTVIMK